MTQGHQLFEAEKKDCIAILGFAPSKKHFPWTDERWSVWGVNDVCNYVPRVDVIFEVHHTMNMGNRRSADWEAVLRGGGKRGSGFAVGAPPTPIFMQEEHPEFPTVMALPANRILTEFGERNLPPLEYMSKQAPGADYITNSISWMIALAILELTEKRKINGVERRVAKPNARLAVVGVSMAADSEYFAQRPSVEHWIGVAKGIGIDVWVPDDAHILRAATLYGYATSTPLAIRLESDMDDLKQKTIAMQQQEAQLVQQLEQTRHELTAIRAQKGYIEGLKRNLVIDTEIDIGSGDEGPGAGRDVVLTLKDGVLIESPVIVPSDNQLQPAGVN